MHYLVSFKFEQPASWEDAYISPDGGRGWSIQEAEDEDSVRDALGDREIEEATPLLPAREYMAVHEARGDLESSKARFVDDPSGALAEARSSVAGALEARGYPPPERADEAPEPRRELLEEYRRADADDPNNLEEMRDAFSRLSDILERLART